MRPTSIPDFTREDFIQTSKPYDFIRDRQKDQRQENDLVQLVSEKAKRAGVRNFKKLYEAYKMGLPSSSK